MQEIRLPRLSKAKRVRVSGLDVQLLGLIKTTIKTLISILELVETDQAIYRAHSVDEADVTSLAKILLRPQVPSQTLPRWASNLTPYTVCRESLIIISFHQLTSVHVSWEVLAVPMINHHRWVVDGEHLRRLTNYSFLMWWRGRHAKIRRGIFVQILI
jgi:hypothetical protein